MRDPSGSKATLRDRFVPATALLLCRHGTTDYPEDRFYPSDTGPALNDAGRHDAQQLGKALSDETLSALYASPTLRTRETAAEVARAAGLAVIFDPALVERSLGRWDGRDAEAVRAEDPDGWSAWKRDPRGFVPEGGESLETFSDRVWTAASAIAQRHPGQKVVVVTHVGAIRALVGRALGMPLEEGKRLIIGPTSVTRLDWSERSVNLVYLNLRPFDLNL